MSPMSTFHIPLQKRCVKMESGAEIKNVTLLRGKIMLTEENVLEIYRAKIALQSQLLEIHHTEGSSVMKNLLRGKSSQFSGRYGVSARTIRDIWNCRTWSYATKILWREETTFFHETADDSYLHAPYAIQVLNFSTMRRSIEDVSNY